MNKTSSSFRKKDFVIVLAFTTLLAVVLNLLYFFLFTSISPLPIPDPIDYSYAAYQALFIMIINGIIQLFKRKRSVENTFNYITGILASVGFNLIFLLALSDIRRMPSINEIQQLYGEDGVPDDLLWLSIPLVILPILIGMLVLPYFLRSREKTKGNRPSIELKTKAIQLLKAYLIVAALIILVNLTYYLIYQSIVPEQNQGKYSITIMVQMNLIMTGVAVMLYLYLLSYSENALPIYIMLTIIFTASAFLAGLPRPDGQPIYDESLWLNIPLAIFSTLGEVLGIPLALKGLIKTQQKRRQKEQRWE